MSILVNESPALRSLAPDSISLFLREMSAMPLLTREQELRFAKEIEAARAASVMELAVHPAALDELASISREIAEGKTPVSTYVIGFMGEDADAAGLMDIAPGAAVEQDDSPAWREAIVAQLTRIDEAAAALRETIRHTPYGSAAYRRVRRELTSRLAALRFTTRMIERLSRSFVQSSGDFHDRLRAIDRRADEARVRLLKGNLRLVVAIARRYIDRGLPLADLVQEGNIGLVKAIERYDHRRGFKFSTYATWWIRQAVLHALGDQARMIRVPVHTADSLSKLSRITLDHVHRAGGRPTHAMLAEKMGVPLGKVRDLANIVRDPVSMETPGAPGSDTTVGEAIADVDMPTPEALTMARHMRRAVTTAIDQLPTREAQVLKLRYGIGIADEYSLREVGRQLNLSAERVRQIEVMAIKRLKSAPGFVGLRDYVTMSEH